MIEAEKEKLSGMARSLNDEELQIVLSEIPTAVLCDELKRRSTEAEHKLGQIENFFKEGEKR